MMNDELTLIKMIEAENSMGDVVVEEVRTDVLCSVKSITRAEHYAGARSDLQPEIMFVINRYDYDGQKEIEFKGKKYEVIRTYLPEGDHNPQPLDIDRLELICKGAD